MTIELMKPSDEIIRCDRCNYVGRIDSFLPNPTGYNPTRCPICKSTNNEYNKRWVDKVFGENK